MCIEPRRTAVDGYARQVAYLEQHPDQIDYEWMAGLGLFQFCGKESAEKIGCLTMVRGGWDAATPALTAAIRADDRLPSDAGNSDYRCWDLQAFAEWQRRLDAELGRKPYVFKEPKQ